MGGNRERFYGKYGTLRDRLNDLETFSIPLIVNTPFEHSFPVRVFIVMFTRAKCPSRWIPHLLIEKWN